MAVNSKTPSEGKLDAEGFDHLMRELNDFCADPDGWNERNCEEARHKRDEQIALLRSHPLWATF